VLPEGVGPKNELPKRRVFHLPSGVSEERLEELLEQQIAGRKLASAEKGSDLADRVDEIAAEIDAKSNLVTGGLLLIGGAVAIANPVVGVGIAAKALLPGVGGVLSKFGAKALGGALRGHKESKVEKEAEKAAGSVPCCSLFRGLRSTLRARSWNPSPRCAGGFREFCCWGLERRPRSGCRPRCRGHRRSSRPRRR
jgi:hypothetical protein